MDRYQMVPQVEQMLVDQDNLKQVATTSNQVFLWIVVEWPCRALVQKPHKIINRVLFLIPKVKS